MNLPKVIAELIDAQKRNDSEMFSSCFSENAIVFDEGRTHKGRPAIMQWNAKTNSEYQTVLTPVEYVETGTEGILKTFVSGTFPGSPIVVNYNIRIENDLIQSLRITG